MLRTAIPVLAALLAGCAHAPPPPAAAAPPAPDPGAYFPLAVGNSWTWLDRSPQAGAAAGVPKSRTVRIVSRDAEGYYVDDARGALRSSRGCIQDRMRRILCAPFETGRSWSSVVSETSTERYRIESTGQVVQVPAGRFEDCVVVRSTNRAGDDAEVVLETTYAPGVGPVRIETWAVVGGKRVPQVKAELSSFRIERTSR